jgi:hypothetical protein
MNERGERYLEHAEPGGVFVARFNPANWNIEWYGRPADTSDALYGWSIESDDEWSYLFAHCHRQFGYDPVFGGAAHDKSCTQQVTVARVPAGLILDRPSYWTGSGWSTSRSDAASVVAPKGQWTMPSEFLHTNGRWLAITKIDDWFGTDIVIESAVHPAGPYVEIERRRAGAKCDHTECTTYFSSWIDGQNLGGSHDVLITSLSHNRWNGEPSWVYRPTYEVVYLPTRRPQRCNALWPRALPVVSSRRCRAGRANRSPLVDMVRTMSTMKVAAAQLAPAFLDREATIDKVLDAIGEATANGAELIAFSETFVPGYPAWADFSNASTFDDPVQKAAFGRYLDAAVDIGRGDLDTVATVAAQLGIFVYLGVAERSTSGSSLYRSLVAIDPKAGIVGVHRKLKPTYGERLMWADGDGNGLVVHDCATRDAGVVRVSGLNCWETGCRWRAPPCGHRERRFTSRPGRVRRRHHTTSAGSLRRRGESS